MAFNLQAELFEQAKNSLLKAGRLQDDESSWRQLDEFAKASGADVQTLFLTIYRLLKLLTSSPASEVACENLLALFGEWIGKPENFQRL